MTVNGGIPDWLNPVPFGDAGHGQLPGDPQQWEVLSEDQLQQMRKQMLESVIAAVVQAVQGLFVPGPFGTALDQLSEWAHNLPTLQETFANVLELLAKVLHFPDQTNVTLPSLIDWALDSLFGIVFPHRIPVLPIAHLTDGLVNLLTNPMFTGDPFMPDNQGEWILDLSTSQNGVGGSARIDANGTQYDLLSVDLIPVGPGQRFEVAAWIKTKDFVATPGSVVIGVAEYGEVNGSDEPVYKMLSRPNQTGTTGWKQWGGKYIVPLRGVEALRVHLEVGVGATSGQMWIDNLFAGKFGLLQMSWVEGLLDRINDFLNLPEIIAAFEEKTGLNIDEGPIKFLQSILDRIKERHGIDLNNPNALISSIENFLLTIQEVIDKFEEKTGLNIDAGPIEFLKSLIQKIKDGQGIDLGSPGALAASLQGFIATIQEMIDHFETQTGLNINEGPIKFLQSLIAKVKASQGIDLTSNATLFTGLKPLIETIAATIQQVIAEIELKTGLNIDEGPAAFLKSLVDKIKASQGVDLTSHDTLFTGLKPLIQNIMLTIQQIIADFELKTGLDIDAGPAAFLASLIAKVKDRNGLDLNGHAALVGSLTPSLSTAAVPTGWQTFLDKVGGQANATNQTLADRLQHLTGAGKFDIVHLLGQLPAAQIGGITINGTAYTTLADAVTSNNTSLQATWNAWMSALTGVQNSTGSPELTADQIAELMATVVANATTIAQIQSAAAAGGSGISGGDDFERTDATGLGSGWAAWQVGGGSKFKLDGHEAVWVETGASGEVRYRRTDPKDSLTGSPFQVVTRVNGVKLAQSQVLGTGCGVDEIYGRVSSNGRSYVVASIDKRTAGQWQVRLRYAPGGIKNPCFLSTLPAPLQAGGWTQEADGVNSQFGNALQSTVGGSGRVDVGTNNLLGSDLIPVVAGNPVDASAWIRTSNFTGTISIGLALYRTANGSDAPTFQTVASPAQSGITDWRFWAGSITVPAGVLAVRLRLSVTSTVGQAWFDNLSVATQAAEVNLAVADCAAPSPGVRYTLECGDSEGSSDALHTYRVLRNGAPILVHTDSAKATISLTGNRGWGFGGQSIDGGVLGGGELSPSSVNAITIADNLPTVTVGTYLRVYRKNTTGITHPDGDSTLPNGCLDFVDRGSSDLAWDIPTQTLTIAKPGPYNITARMEFDKDILGVDRWDLLLYRYSKTARQFVVVSRGGQMGGGTGANADAVAGTFPFYFEAGDQVRIGIGNKGTGLAADISVVGDAAGLSTWMTVTRGA